MNKKLLAKARRTISEMKEARTDLTHPDPARHRLADCFRYVVQFEQLAGLVYQARKVQKSEGMESGLEEELSESFHTLLSLQAAPVETSLYARWIRDYRLAWRKNLPLFTITTMLFLGSLVIGWFCAVQRPEYASLLIGQHMQERVISSSPWFKELNDNPLLGGVQIALNNIAVSMKMFAGGCLLGIGGILLLIYNGIQFGSVFGFCYLYKFDKELLEFVLSHGPLELSIIVASAFCGMLVGKVFLSWPLRNLSDRASKAGSVAFTVLLGILPWLVLAASFEAFVSPSAQFSISFKITAGIVLALCFWVWTFWPVSDQERIP
ncbi:MAG: stage II sporulation protein M [Oligoflexus sp.]|nr:stage II sporulation protein M [Oligoflexus sp.]